MFERRCVKWDTVPADPLWTRMTGQKTQLICREWGTVYQCGWEEYQMIERGEHPLFSDYKKEKKVVEPFNGRILLEFERPKPIIPKCLNQQELN